MKAKIKADIRQTDFILILIWDHSTATVCDNICIYTFVGGRREFSGFDVFILNYLE